MDWAIYEQGVVAVRSLDKAVAVAGKLLVGILRATARAFGAFLVGAGGARVIPAAFEVVVQVLKNFVADELRVRDLAREVLLLGGIAIERIVGPLSLLL